jgi:hypothetical protein
MIMNKFEHLFDEKNLQKILTNVMPVKSVKSSKWRAWNRWPPLCRLSIFTFKEGDRCEDHRDVMKAKIDWKLGQPAYFSVFPKYNKAAESRKFYHKWTPVECQRS